MSDQPSPYSLEAHLPCEIIDHLGFEVETAGDQVVLPPYGVCFAQLKPHS